MEVRIRESKIGASIVEEGGSIPEHYTGIDSRFKKGDLDIGFEMALSPGGGRAVSCAGKIKNTKTKTGFLIYDVNRLYSNLLGRIPADGRKVNGEQRGLSAVVEREISRRFYLRCSIERWTNRRSYSLERKLSLRFQLIKKLKRKKLLFHMYPLQLFHRLCNRWLLPNHMMQEHHPMDELLPLGKDLLLLFPTPLL